MKQQEERDQIRVPVRNLGDGVYPVEIVRDVEALDLPLFFGELRIKGKLTKENDRLVFDLKASAQGHFECTRCADPFDRVIRADLKVSFVPPQLGKPVEEDENVHSYEPLLKPYVDILDDVRDALALAIPMKHLCRSDCAGLCPTCGKNWNREECDCSISTSETGFSALKALQERLRAEEFKRPGAGAA